MNRLRKLLRLPVTDRFLLIRAVVLLGVVRVGLWLLPFKKLQRLLSQVQTRARSWNKGRFRTERGIWAVQVASRYALRTTCLTRALAAQVLLGFDGIPASVRIGVAKEKVGELEAHAWLERDGKILMGGSEADHRYVRLLVSRLWKI